MEGKVTEAATPDSHNEATGFLQRLNIRKIAIIDDSFEPPRPSAEYFDALTLLLTDDDLRQEVASVCGLNPDDAEPNIINEKHLEQLWSALRDIEGDTALHGALSRLFQEHRDQLEPLTIMIDALQTLGVTVLLVPPSKSEQLEDAEIWFFDLFWDAPSDEPKAWAMSASIANEQFKKRHMDPPLCFLMSYDSDRLYRVRDDFRKTAECPAGYFMTFDKKLLYEEQPGEKFIKWFQTSLDEKKVRFRRNVAGLTRAMIGAAQGALHRYIQALQELAAEDYAHIYRFALANEGAPLGSYILWLFEPLFEHYLRTDKDVEHYRKNIDALHSKDIPVLFDMLQMQTPSKQLSEVHRTRLWEQIPEDVRRLYQGELLEDQEGKWLVLNANCDLIFSEDEVRPQKDVSLLLLKGEVSPFDVGKHLTEFYERQDDGGLEIVHVSWKFDGVITIPYSKYSMRFTRLRWRMRSPHVSELVQRWSYQATRFGTPVSPPAMFTIRIKQMWHRKLEAEQWVKQDLDVVEDAHVFLQTHKRGQLVFPQAFTMAEAVRKQVPSNLASQQSVKDGLAKLGQNVDGLDVLDGVAKVTTALAIAIGNSAAEQAAAKKKYTLILVTEPTGKDR